MSCDRETQFEDDRKINDMIFKGYYYLIILPAICGRPALFSADNRRSVQASTPEVSRQILNTA